jgi:hypothetical protein
MCSNPEIKLAELMRLNDSKQEKKAIGQTRKSQSFPLASSSEVRLCESTAF